MTLIETQSCTVPYYYYCSKNGSNVAIRVKAGIVFVSGALGARHHSAATPQRLQPRQIPTEYFSHRGIPKYSSATARGHGGAAFDYSSGLKQRQAVIKTLPMKDPMMKAGRTYYA